MTEQDARRMPYTKPEALDIGSVAPVAGQSCGKGNIFDSSGACAGVGNTAGAVGCYVGNTGDFVEKILP